MRVIQPITGLAALVALASYGYAAEPSAPAVQLRSLVQHPKQYEGKVVAVHGFVAFGREGDALCTSLRRDGKAFCVEIERSDGFLNQRSDLYALERHRVSFTAKFAAIRKEDLDPPCPDQMACVALDFGPLYWLRVISTISTSP